MYTEFLILPHSKLYGTWRYERVNTKKLTLVPMNRSQRECDAVQYLSENKSPQKNRNLNCCCALFPIAVAQCFSELLLRSAFPFFLFFHGTVSELLLPYFAQPLQSSPPHLRPVSRTCGVRYGQPARPNWQILGPKLPDACSFRSNSRPCGFGDPLRSALTHFDECI